VELKFPPDIRYQHPFPAVEIQRILSVQWFRRPGLATDAVERALSAEWSDFRLERRNDITACLAVRLRSRGSEWNKCALVFSQFVEECVTPAIQNEIRRCRLPEGLIQLAKWDVVSYMQEVNYRRTCRSTFFGHVLQGYEVGGLPHGWLGQFPQGHLLVG
jgi:hypothetical protein